MALTLITEDSLRSFLADREITAFDNGGAEGTLPDRVSALIKSTCNLIAGIVNASGKYPRLELNKCRVPAELELCALVWIRHALLSDLPDMSDLEGSPRSKQYSTASSILENVRRGDFFLSPYTGGDEISKVLSAGEPYENWCQL